jgi:hypothetical protein
LRPASAEIGGKAFVSVKNTETVVMSLPVDRFRAPKKLRATFDAV